MKILLALTLGCCLLSCKKNISIPTCVQNRIDSALAKPKGTLFDAVAAYNYKGKEIYLYTPGCCDRFIEAWDSNCQYLFSPSGGITGCGDCNHSDFFTTAKFIRMIWEDPRP